MTTTFQWKEDYRIDGGSIDDEHRQLLALANDVLSIVDPRRQVEEVKEAVKGLYMYMEVHFGNEEKIQQEIGFPDHQRHVQLHKTIVIDMNQLMKNCDDLGDFVVRLRYAMIDWVVQHILDEDTKIRDHMRAKV